MIKLPLSFGRGKKVEDVPDFSYIKKFSYIFPILKTFILVTQPYDEMVVLMKFLIKFAAMKYLRYKQQVYNEVFMQDI